jgi:hypothetical protein
MAMSKLYDQEKAKDMPKVILRVRGNGANGDGDLVAEFRCLSAAVMQTKPEVMLWGERVFVFRHLRNNGDMVYVEGLGFPLVEGATCEEVTSVMNHEG